VYCCIISLSIVIKIVIKILFVLVDVKNRALRHRPILEVRVSLLSSSWYKNRKKLWSFLRNSVTKCSDSEL
jgi:hypothetical protein